jgi:hypothetical protein
MKRIVLLATGLCALAIAVPVAQTSPTSEDGCSVEHLSGDPCQGPDANPAANACRINTWVGDASCTLTVPDGVANFADGLSENFAELQDTNWHTEAHLVVRDTATGQVLLSRDLSSTVPVADSPEPPDGDIPFGAALSPLGGAEVVCEVTGTHTPAGAAFSAEAAARGFGRFNNNFRCQVN